MDPTPADIIDSMNSADIMDVAKLLDTIKTFSKRLCITTSIHEDWDQQREKSIDYYLVHLIDTETNDSLISVKRLTRTAARRQANHLCMVSGLEQDEKIWLGYPPSSEFLRYEKQTG